MLPIFLLAVFAGLIYSNSISAPLLFDNNEIIGSDQRLREATAHNVVRIFSEQYWETSPTGLYRPFTTLSYWFNYSVLGSGSNAAGYHLFNITLHIVNAALVYALGLLLFEDLSLAFVCAGIWAIHPILTEAVTNIVGRADMLAAFGVLAGLLAYRKALQSSAARRMFWFLAVALAVAIGVFSKENAVAVLGVAVVFDLAYRIPVSWKTRVLGYAAMALPVIVYFALRTRVLASTPYLETQFGDNPLLFAGFWNSRITAAKVVGKYLLLLVWPARLSADYSYNEIPLFQGFGSPASWASFAGITCAVALLAIGIWSFRRSRCLFFSILFFFVTFAPMSNMFVLIGTIMGERFLYLPSIGLIAALICAAQALWRRAPIAGERQVFVRAAIAIALIALAARTYARNSDWGNEQRFWLATVEAAPGSYKAQISAATSSTPHTADDWQRMIHHADAALAILDPLPDRESPPGGYFDAGRIYRAFGEAVQSGKPEGLRGQQPEFWYRKALGALTKAVRLEEQSDARYREENARRGMPDLTSLASKFYLELGRVYMDLGDPKDAAAVFERGRASESDPNLLQELASAYQQLGRFHEAALAGVEAIAVDPNRPELPSLLIDLYRRIDPQGCAVTKQNGQDTLNWDCAVVHQDICAASKNVAGHYDARRQINEAAAIRHTAEHDLGCAANLLK